MANEFFMRFNIHKSWGDYFGSSPYICRDVLDATDEDIKEFLGSLDNVQEVRAEYFKSKFDLQKLKGKRVLFFGDSLTSDRLGYRDCVTKSCQFEAKDGSFSGGTSSDILCIAEEYASTKPDLISIMIGTNDAIFVDKDKKCNRTSLDEYRRNLSEIICICKKYCRNIMIMTIPGVDESKLNVDGAIKTNTNLNVERYNDVIRDVALDFGVVLNSTKEVLDCNDEIFENDGLHLCDKGQKILAECWIKKVLEIF